MLPRRGFWSVIAIAMIPSSASTPAATVGYSATSTSASAATSECLWGRARGGLSRLLTRSRPCLVICSIGRVWRWRPRRLSSKRITIAIRLVYRGVRCDFGFFVWRDGGCFKAVVCELIKAYFPLRGGTLFWLGGRGNDAFWATSE
jgi:hypothetical protein